MQGYIFLHVSVLLGGGLVFIRCDDSLIACGSSGNVSDGHCLGWVVLGQSNAVVDAYMRLIKAVALVQ